MVIKSENVSQKSIVCEDGVDRNESLPKIGTGTKSMDRISGQLMIDVRQIQGKTEFEMTKPEEIAEINSDIDGKKSPLQSTL